MYLATIMKIRGHEFEREKWVVSGKVQRVEKEGRSAVIILQSQKYVGNRKKKNPIYN